MTKGNQRTGAARPQLTLGLKPVWGSNAAAITCRSAEIHVEGQLADPVKFTLPTLS